MFLRRITKLPSIQRAIGKTMSNYLKLVFNTGCWKIEGRQNIPSGPCIIVFWHRHMAMAPFAWIKGRDFYMLISGHSDGRMIANTVKNLGIESIVGSSSKGGTKALRQLLGCLKQGHSIGITPDGPRGPYESVNEGVFSLSMLAQVPVIPLSYSTSRFLQLSSWDRFIIPVPFGKGILIFGDPINPPSRNDNKQEFIFNVKKSLEKTLQKSCSCTI